MSALLSSEVDVVQENKVEEKRKRLEKEVMFCVCVESLVTGFRVCVKS